MTAPRASVVIPTKNAIKSIRPVLTALFEQQLVGGFDVLVIDSGSKDGTLDVLAEFPLRLVRIPAAEFSHGGTRNLGASLTTGEFIAFLTHDAQPANPQWLAALTAPFDLDPAVAGVFGRHRPYPGCDPIDARNIDGHFANFGNQVSIVRITSPEDYHRRQGWYDFFSNNNSALRRAVWTTHPFPVVAMAEDQRWAQQILQAGFAKAYAPDAVVFHSHSYRPREWFHRWYDEFTSYHDLNNPGQMRSVVRAAGYAVLASKGDLGYLRRTLPRGQAIRAGWRAVLNNLARAAGGYLGSNYDRIPPRWRAKLSMQHQLVSR